MYYEHFSDFTSDWDWGGGREGGEHIHDQKSPVPNGDLRKWKWRWLYYKVKNCPHGMLSRSMLSSLLWEDRTCSLRKEEDSWLRKPVANGAWRTVSTFYLPENCKEGRYREGQTTQYAEVPGRHLISVRSQVTHVARTNLDLQRHVRYHHCYD